MIRTSSAETIREYTITKEPDVECSQSHISAPLVTPYNTERHSTASAPNKGEHCLTTTQPNNADFTSAELIPLSQHISVVYLAPRHSSLISWISEQVVKLVEERATQEAAVIEGEGDTD